MSHTISPLDIDALIQKHVRLSPASRNFQLVCLTFAAWPLYVLVWLALVIGLDLINFAFGHVINSFIRPRRRPSIISKLSG